MIEELKSLDWKKILLTSAAVFGVISMGAAGGYWYGTKQTVTPTPISQTPQIPEIPEATPTTEPEPELEQITPTQVRPPETFGYTKTTDLYGVGVRATFPENITLRYSDPESSYTAAVSDYDAAYISLQNYYGGGRRDWFLANYGSPTTFKPFAATTHSGYLSYGTDSNGDLTGPFYYFAAVRSDQMLVVRGYNNQSSIYFFGSDLERFKSFLSTIEIIEQNTEKVDPSHTQREDLFRYWSETRLSIWENPDLGLRITVPEWIESEASGTRITQKASVHENTVSISSPLVAEYPRLEILDEKYKGQGFEQVVSEVLPGAGFCKTEWKESKMVCEGQLYCYTRNEVVQNLFLKGTTTVGPYEAQRWTLRADFSNKNDCRAEDWWIIRAKDGRFVTTNVSPRGEITRVENL